VIIPGILASGVSGHLGGNYYSIATQTVGAGGVSSVTFSSIPQTFTHLQIRLAILTSSGTPDFAFTFNGDNGNNYDFHGIEGSGSGVNGGNSGTNRANMPIAVGGNASTVPSVAILDVLDYTSTSKTKPMRSLLGYDGNGVGYAMIRSGLWYTTPVAITSITATVSAGTVNQYSSIALYGVK